MLKGKTVTLRPVQEEDLPQLYEHVVNIENRGEYYPRRVQSMSELRKDLAEGGMWTNDWGLLAIIDNGSGKLIGQIVWFKTVQYMDELEIGYILYETSGRRRGAMTEALNMLTWYLFDTKLVNRIRLCIATENTASRRVAEKGGYRHEGTMRQCFFSAGRYQDMELYAMLRSDERAGAPFAG